MDLNSIFTDYLTNSTSAAYEIFQVFLAEGLPVESYLDTGNGAEFGKGGGPVDDGNESWGFENRA